MKAGKEKKLRYNRQEFNELRWALKIFSKKEGEKFGGKRKKGVTLQHFRRTEGPTGPVRGGRQSSLKRLERRVVQEKERSQFRPGRIRRYKRKKARYTTKSLILAQDER